MGEKGCDSRILLSSAILEFVSLANVIWYRNPEKDLE